MSQFYLADKSCFLLMAAALSSTEMFKGINEQTPSAGLRNALGRRQWHLKTGDGLALIQGG